MEYILKYQWFGKSHIFIFYGFQNYMLYTFDIAAVIAAETVSLRCDVTASECMLPITYLISSTTGKWKKIVFHFSLAINIQSRIYLMDMIIRTAHAIPATRFRSLRRLYTKSIQKDLALSSNYKQLTTVCVYSKFQFTCNLKFLGKVIS